MRSTFLRVGLFVLILALLVGGCAPAPAPAPQVVEKTVVVEQTVVVQGKPETVVVTATPEPKAPEKPFKVAVIMPSSKDDMEWSQSLYEGLVRLQKEMGKDKLEFTITENLYQIPDATAAARDYASQGYNLVIAHGSQYGASLAQVAPDFPNVSFAWGTSTETFQKDGINNIFAYQPSAELGGYVLGTMAGMMTKKNVIGITGPIEAGDARLYNKGFEMGAKAANPKVKVNISYTGSFSDVSLMAASAETQIKNGADVLSGTSQSMVGAIGVLKDKDILWFGSAWDQTSLAPKNVVTCLVYRWDILLKDMIQSNKAGVPGGKAYFMTFKNGGLELKYNDAMNIPAEVKAAADAAIKGINEGKITVEIK
jgi:basic membrane lipoprotein Med (substrate-binding protein (PBP1-ABC) superfamily)